MNKRGNEKIFSIWWFISIVVITVVIALVTISFMSKDVDVRKVSAKILYERLAECLIENGYLDSRFKVGDLNWDLFNNCNLREELFSSDGSGYYFEVIFLDKDRIRAGDRSLRNPCLASNDVDFIDSPGCISNSEKVIYFSLDEKKFLEGDLKIFAISNQEINSKGILNEA